MEDLRQTPAWANYLKTIGWKVEKLEGNYYYLKKVPFLGYLLKIQRPQEISFKNIKSLEKKYKIYQISIEPNLPFFSLSHNQLLKEKFKKSKSFYLPTKTIQIDLTQSQNKILSQMRPKTRYNIKVAQRNNINIDKSDNIEEFVKFWRENFERKKSPLLTQKKNLTFLHKAFKTNANLLIAKKDNAVIAELFLLRTKDTIFYMYASSNNLGRKLFAPTLLTWQAILLAKKNKCKIFDFDGIYDERFPLKNWQGFTRFKKGFGGYEIDYPGCFIKTNSIIKL